MERMKNGSSSSGTSSSLADTSADNARGIDNEIKQKVKECAESVKEQEPLWRKHNKTSLAEELHSLDELELKMCERLYLFYCGDGPRF